MWIIILLVLGGASAMFIAAAAPPGSALGILFFPGLAAFLVGLWVGILVWKDSNPD